MSDLTASDRPNVRKRRERSDAVRSREAVVTAAIGVLAANPDASLTDVARAAGLSRQTLYVHFGSRDRLLSAVMRRLTDVTLRMLDEARLEDGDPWTALKRFLDVLGELPAQYFRVAEVAAAGLTAENSDQLHAPIKARITGLARRGQRTGDFTSAVSAEWLAAATIALGHMSFELQASVDLSEGDVVDALGYSVRRLYRADDSVAARQS